MSDVEILKRIWWSVWVFGSLNLLVLLLLLIAVTSG